MSKQAKSYIAHLIKVNPQLATGSTVMKITVESFLIQIEKAHINGERTKKAGKDVMSSLFGGIFSDN